jgi:hypothetical protein
MTTPSPTRRRNSPSEKSLALFYRLVTERQLPEWGETGQARMAAAIEWIATEEPDQFALSRKIDWIMQQPRDQREIAHGLEPGVYEVGTSIYVVKWNRTKTALYAKVLVEIGGRRQTAAGEVANIEFEYAAGAVAKIRPEHRMTVERARTLTLVYGHCLNCGRFLKAVESVERGIGPVCAKAFAA